MLKISDKFAKETKQGASPKRSRLRGVFIEHWLGFAIVLIVFARGAISMSKILE